MKEIAKANFVKRPRIFEELIAPDIPKSSKAYRVIKTIILDSSKILPLSVHKRIYGFICSSVGAAPISVSWSCQSENVMSDMQHVGWTR